MRDVRQPAGADNQAVRLEAFTLHKQSCGRSLEAMCRIVRRQHGWELRLEVNGDLQRSRVCGTSQEALETREAWKLGLLDSGWS